MTLRKFIKHQTRRLLNSDFCSSFISSTLCNYIRMVKKTTDWQIEGIDNFLKIKDEGVVCIAWHGRAIMLPVFFRTEYCKLSALVSPHRDGQLIAKLLRKFGIRTIDGSSNENANGAAVGLMHALQEDKSSIFIVPDGPRGPRMRLGKSPVYYAYKTGKPIVTMTYSIANSFIIEKAWDKTMIPVPFSKGIFNVSEPIYIPRDATPEQLEEYRKKIEHDFNETCIRIDRALGMSPVLPDEDKPKVKKHR